MANANEIPWSQPEKVRFLSTWPNRQNRQTRLSGCQKIDAAELDFGFPRCAFELSQRSNGAACPHESTTADVGSNSSRFFS